MKMKDQFGGDPTKIGGRNKHGDRRVKKRRYQNGATHPKEYPTNEFQQQMPLVEPLRYARWYFRVFRFLGDRFGSLLRRRS